MPTRHGPRTSRRSPSAAQEHRGSAPPAQRQRSAPRCAAEPARGGRHFVVDVQLKVRCACRMERRIRPNHRRVVQFVILLPGPGHPLSRWGGMVVQRHMELPSVHRAAAHRVAETISSFGRRILRTRLREMPAASRWLRLAPWRSDTIQQASSHEEVPNTTIIAITTSCRTLSLGHRFRQISVTGQATVFHRSRRKKQMITLIPLTLTGTCHNT